MKPRQQGMMESTHMTAKGSVLSTFAMVSSVTPIASCGSTALAAAAAEIVAEAAVAAAAAAAATAAAEAAATGRRPRRDEDGNGEGDDRGAMPTALV
jgi:hypothetical protein